MRKTEKEISEIKKQNTFIIEKLVLEGDLSNEEINKQFSGVFHTNDLKTFAWDWIPEEYSNGYDIDIDYIKTLPSETFAEKYIHPLTIKQQMPIYLQMQKGVFDSTINAFNYIRLNEKTDYKWVHNTWLFSSELQKIVGIVHFLEDLEREVSEEEKLLGEYDFIRANFNKFMQLTTQQKHVLKLLAMGYTNQMVASELYISTNTVRSHRNNIHKILDLRWRNINHLQVYMKYGYHFGLL